MSKIDPFVRVLSFLIENSFPKCMNVEVQLLPDCAFWLFLCSISSTFTTSRADISVLLPNACVREIFADSCSICESRTHTASRERWFWWTFGWFRWKSSISRFQFCASAWHCDCTKCLRLIFADFCVYASGRLGGHVRDFDFLKKRWFSCIFMHFPLVEVVWVRLSQIDQSRTEISKNLLKPESVGHETTAASVRHF